MSPDPFKDLDPAQPVNILPRHLAGPGAVELLTVWPFPFGEDWSLHQPEQGTAYATSPCLRLWTRFTPEPEKRGEGTWTIGANRVPFGETAWQIVFDATTPVELLHDVHAELLDLYREEGNGDEEQLFDVPAAPYEGYAPLFARDWSHDVKTDGTQTFFSPDGLAGVQHRYSTRDSDALTWRAWGGLPSTPAWQAHFSFATPTTLVAAFTTSLISTEPLHRTVQDVPLHNRRDLDLATTATK